MSYCQGAHSCHGSGPWHEAGHPVSRPLVMWPSGHPEMGGMALALPGRRDRSLRGKARRKAARASRA